MDISEKALGVIEKTGISVSIILIIAAGFFVYYTLQQLKLVNLQIKQAERDLNIDPDKQNYFEEVFGTKAPFKL